MTIMTQKITLRTLQATEFSPTKGELITTAIIPASELIERRSIRFGLEPNLRIPKKSTEVIRGIVKRIESGEAFHIDSPVKISCRMSRVMEDNKIELIVDPKVDGIMDGGHRCRAFEVASIQGLNLENVTVQIQLFSGLGQQELRQKAIYANTSRGVSTRSRQYFSGAFDELISRVDMKKYPACFWRDGEQKDGTGIFCQGTHILSLLGWLNLKTYDRHNSKDAWPHSRAHGTAGLGNEKNTIQIKDSEQIAHLLDDAFWMEKASIQKMLASKQFLGCLFGGLNRIPGFTYPSLLLDGTEIKYRLPSFIAGPIIFPARKMLDRSNQWQYPPRQWMQRWVNYAVPKYIEEIKRQGKGEVSISSLLISGPVIWRKMDALIGKFREEHNLPDIY